MNNTDNNSFDEIGENSPSEIKVSNRILAILTSLAILSSLIGFFIILSILVGSIRNSTLSYPHGFIIGLLLLMGGVLLILGLRILKKESLNSLSSSSLIKDNN